MEIKDAYGGCRVRLERYDGIKFEAKAIAVGREATVEKIFGEDALVTDETGKDWYWPIASLYAFPEL